MTDLLPAPVRNADSAPYSDGGRDGELLIRHCRTCGHYHFMPRSLGPKCWSEDLEWVESAGKGKVDSYTIIYRASHANYTDKVPYIGALVELDEGPRIMTNIYGSEPLNTRIDDVVELSFEDRADGARVPQFVRKA